MLTLINKGSSRNIYIYIYIYIFIYIYMYIDNFGHSIQIDK